MVNKDSELARANCDNLIAEVPHSVWARSLKGMLRKDHPACGRPAFPPSARSTRLHVWVWEGVDGQVLYMLRKDHPCGACGTEGKLFSPPDPPVGCVCGGGPRGRQHRCRCAH